MNEQMSSSETVASPAWDAPVEEWRRYAGALRQQVGQLRRELLDIREAHVDLRAQYVDLGVRHERMRRSKKNETHLVNQIERDLADGDIPAAVDRLAARRARIDANAARTP